MSFTTSRRDASAHRAFAPRAALAWLALLALGAVATDAASATFYRWTDKEGNVHYSDAPPKGFSGTVTPVEVDTAYHGMPAVQPSVENPTPGSGTGATDLLTQRRATRALLEDNLAKARERLELARKALAEVSDMQGEEGQVMQRQVDPASINPNVPGSATAPSSLVNPDATQSAPARGGMFGMTPRSNCRSVKTTDGKTVLICPTVVPNEEHYQRVTQLEAEVHLAEQAVEDAERAYRRGVD